MGQAHSVGIALMVKKAPRSTELLSFRKRVKPRWQRAALLSVSSHLCQEDFFFSSKASAHREESLECSRVERDPTTQWPPRHSRKNQGPPASFCSPSMRNQHSGKHSPAGAAIQEQICPAESQENIFFKCPKYHKTSQKESPLCHCSSPCLYRCPQPIPHATCLPRLESRTKINSSLLN